jgi:flagellar biosynthesis protein FlhB
MPDSSQTEKPTPRRLLKAREEGRFAVSREFVAAVQFTAFVAALAALGPRCFDGLQQMMRQALAGAFHGDLTVGRLQADLLQLVLPNLFALGLMAILLLGATLATQMATTQLGFALAHLSPDFSRLDPLKRLRSLPRQNLPAFLQALMLLPIFLVVLWGIVQPNLPEFLLLPLANPEAASARVFGVLQALLWKASFALLLLGAIDLVRQRRHYVADLRMSQQEIREEHKELEGNPQVKIRIRRLQRDLLRRNMMKEVPHATAVITNPTHFAVAIRYSLDSMAAPTVVAKGKNYLAQRIKKRAIEHQVPIVENAPLAQALYKAADIGQEIPPSLYRAVAEVLAYIFRLSGRGRC